MNAHTPGPWVAVELPTAIAIKSHMGNVANIQRGSMRDQQQANARLIASAPDLLAALKSVMEMMDDEIKKASDAELAFGLSDPECPAHVKGELACVIACRAAIAKAEGGAA